MVLAVFTVCGLSVSWHDVPPAASLFGLFPALLLFYGWRREPRLTSLLRIVTWSITLPYLCALALYVPMRHATPLADPLLARMDSALGFDEGWVRAWALAHANAKVFLDFAYNSLFPFVESALITATLLGRVASAEVTLLAIILALFVALAVAYVFPAVGPWEVFPFEPQPIQVNCGRVISCLRGSQPYTINLAHLDPIIGTPSWHVILCVLGALAVREIRVLGLVSGAWATVIVASTLTTGWHYLADVLMGLVVAFGAYVLAGWIHRRLLSPSGAENEG